MNSNNVYSFLTLKLFTDCIDYFEKLPFETALDEIPNLARTKLWWASWEGRGGGGKKVEI